MTEMIAICFFMEAALYGRRYRQVKAGVYGNAPGPEFSLVNG
jgi:hypothetical protein